MEYFKAMKYPKTNNNLNLLINSSSLIVAVVAPNMVIFGCVLKSVDLMITLIAIISVTRTNH